MSLTKYCHHHLPVHIQNMDISQNTSIHASKITSLCHHYPPIKTPCRRTTHQLSWLPRLLTWLAIFQQTILGGRCQLLKTGSHSQKRKRCEKHISKKTVGKAQEGKALQTGNARGSHSQVCCSLRWHQNLKNPAAAELLQWHFLIPKIFAHASRKHSILIIPLKSHNKQAESPVASDLLFTPKAALRSGIAQDEAASKGSFRTSFPLAQ